MQVRNRLNGVRPPSGMPTQNVHVRRFRSLATPRQIKDALPLTPAAQDSVLAGRHAVQRILAGQDRRLLAIVGPCSIHDEAAALEYAARLRELSAAVAERVLVLMRVYFEKPRTTVGWKGFINDPHLDGSFDIETGLRRARALLLRIAESGVPAASELLEPITPQYIADLLTWAAIGARTTESQTHRQMASGLSMPVGFKNGTDGHLQTAIDALRSAGAPHSFLGIDDEGRTAIVDTTGNPWTHLILRGGRSGPNFAAEVVAEAAAALREAGLVPRIMVDCSHANSGKRSANQCVAWRSVLAQRRAGPGPLIGAMLESHLHAGAQPLGPDPAALRYGVSITDECIGWEETAALLHEAYAAEAP